MKEPILVVMAAGIGSRYGGLKQMDPVGTNGELIIDFSVYDAIRAGFKKVIFIINRSIEESFKSVVGDRLCSHIEIEYAFQELDDLPEGISIPAERKKPWGTAHAVYVARNLIDAPFAVINADDYYGEEAFVKMYDFLIDVKPEMNKYAMVGYLLKNTVTEHGYVSRGICTLDSDTKLVDIVERVHIEKHHEKIVFKEDDSWKALEEETIVSMNMWGFTPVILDFIEGLLPDFFSNDIKANPLKSELFLPYVVDHTIKNNVGEVEILKTDEKWYGVTYIEDKAKVIDAISTMINQGKYPNKLWEA